MKKYFWLMATVLISSMSLTSCGDDDDDPTSPTNPSSNKFDVYASAVLDRNLAEYGYMEVSYDYKGKTETFQLKKDDKSDQLPTSNDFGSTVLKYVNSKHTVNYTNDNLIVRNIVLKDFSENEGVTFKYKFVVDANHPALTEDGNRFFLQPNVIGYISGYFTYVRYTLSGGNVLVNSFDNWLSNRAKEVSVTFSRNSIND